MLSERLKTLLTERKISINDFAEMCDLPLETVRNVYYGKTNDPKLSTVLKMADSLNMSVNCLMGKCPHTPEERAIIENYRKSGKHGKAIILLTSKYQASAAKIANESTEKQKIRCIVLQGEIGNGIVYETCEMTEIETSVKNAYLGIQMTNNNLAPTFCKNDILLIENRVPKSGEKAVFFKGSKAYIRKFVEKEDCYILKTLHDGGEDIKLKRMDEVDYVGTVIDIVRE